MKKFAIAVLALFALTSIPNIANAECLEKKVVMLMTDWCPYCRQAKAFFIRNRISFTEFNVEKDPRGRDLARHWEKEYGEQGVPIIIFPEDKVYFSGFNPTILSQRMCLG